MCVYYYLILVLFIKTSLFILSLLHNCYFITSRPSRIQWPKTREIAEPDNIPGSILAEFALVFHKIKSVQVSAAQDKLKISFVPQASTIHSVISTQHLLVMDRHRQTHSDSIYCTNVASQW